jgi:hypothetical protein
VKKNDRTTETTKYSIPASVGPEAYDPHNEADAVLFATDANDPSEDDAVCADASEVAQ